MTGRKPHKNKVRPTYFNDKKNIRHFPADTLLNSDSQPEVQGPTLPLIFILGEQMEHHCELCGGRAVHQLFVAHKLCARQLISRRALLRECAIVHVQSLEGTVTGTPWGM